MEKIGERQVAVIVEPPKIAVIAGIGKLTRFLYLFLRVLISSVFQGFDRDLRKSAANYLSRVIALADSVPMSPVVRSRASTGFARGPIRSWSSDKQCSVHVRLRGHYVHPLGSLPRFQSSHAWPQCQTAPIDAPVALLHAPPPVVQLSAAASVFPCLPVLLQTALLCVIWLRRPLRHRLPRVVQD